MDYAQKEVVNDDENENNELLEISLLSNANDLDPITILLSHQLNL